MFICVYMCVYIFVCVCVYVYVCIWVNACIYIFKSLIHFPKRFNWNYSFHQWNLFWNDYMIANCTLHSYVTLQYYDAIFPEKSFFQCRSNFLLSPCGSYVFSFLIQNDSFTSLQIYISVDSFNAYDFIIFHSMIIVTRMICHKIFCFLSSNFRKI